MAITAHWYSLAAQAQWSGNPVNWLSDTIMCGLVGPSYTPDQDHDQFWSTPQTFEITGTGYTAGGQQLTGMAIGAPSNHVIPLLASASSWPNATLTFQYAVIYKQLSSAATSPLIGWIDFGNVEQVSGGTLEIAWDTTYGVLRATAN